jgi:uncharacterized protein involved in response to NO
MNSRWQARHLLDAPHRLSFFLALCVLVFASAWWALVQLDRLGIGWGLGYAVSPTLMHSSLMTFGFIPLLFSGFLFTAGPKWLGVRPVTVLRLMVPMGLQAVGWMLWVAGGHLGLGLAVFGAALAWVGLAWIQWLFWRLLIASVVPDRMHAKVIAVAGLVGVVALGAVIASLLLDGGEMARLWVLTALWGFIATTYVAVAHRMIPFFTASAVPMLRAWRPNWVLGLLLVAVVLEVSLQWMEWLGISGGQATRVWMLLRGLLELAIGSVIVWLAFVWGMVRSLKIRLLAMLHVGFVWLGIAFVLAGLSQLLGFHAGTPLLGLGALHALTMGFFGSTMLAMVTRVSSGHSGRPLVADNRVWRTFWVLQLAVVLRIVGAVPGAPAWLMACVALLWLGVVMAWSSRMLGWYGQLRTDGQPG